MSDLTDPKLKRLLFRARHMGTNENDLLFGAFATANLSSLSNEQLDRFEKLLNINDPDLFDWVTGRKAAPAEHDNDVLMMMRDFKLVVARS